MDPWLEIPKDRKRLPIGRMCVIMALTVLLFLAVLSRGEVVGHWLEQIVFASAVV